MAKKKSKDNILEKLVPVLLVASIGLAFAVGVLWQKVTQLQSGGTKVSATAQQAGTGDTAAPPEQGPSQGKLDDEQASKLPSVTDEDHVRGNRNASVYLIEYSDYECPFCARFHPTAQQVVDEYGGDVAWVYRHYPLDQIHPKARPAAVASECVAELAGNDAFWTFTDYVFENQATALSDLEAAASQAGVNASDFNSCVESERYADTVENELQEGITAGVRGTPGNFIVNSNGDVWFIPGAYPYDQIKPMIDEALQS